MFGTSCSRSAYFSDKLSMRSTANAVFTVALSVERGLYWCPETLGSVLPAIAMILLTRHSTDLHNEHNP
jgi:hypothetical protein